MSVGAIVVKLFTTPFFSGISDLYKGFTGLRRKEK